MCGVVPLFDDEGWKLVSISVCNHSSVSATKSRKGICNQTCRGHDIKTQLKGVCMVKVQDPWTQDMLYSL